MAPADPKLTYVTAYVYGTKVLKRRYHGPCRPKVDVCYSIHSWNKDLVWQFWVMGTELKSTIYGPCRPKVDECFNIRSWNIGDENKTKYDNFGSWTHGNCTLIQISRPLSTQSWRLLQHTFMEQRRWKQDLVWQFWVIGRNLNPQFTAPVDLKLTNVTTYVHGT